MIQTDIVEPVTYYDLIRLKRRMTVRSHTYIYIFDKLLSVGIPFDFGILYLDGGGGGELWVCFYGNCFLFSFLFLSHTHNYSKYFS